MTLDYNRAFIFCYLNYDTSSITLFSGKYSEIASSFNLKNKQTYCERIFLEINFYGLDKLTAIKYSAVTGFIIA
jgi:hypothetical protein